MKGIVFEPMFSAMLLGAWEILLLLLALLVFASVAAAAIALAVWLSSRKKKEALTTDSVSPTSTKRFCPHARIPGQHQRLGVQGR